VSRARLEQDAQRGRDAEDDDNDYDDEPSMAATTKKPRLGATGTSGMCRLVRLGGGHRSVRLSRAQNSRPLTVCSGAANARLSGLSRGLISVDAELGLSTDLLTRRILRAIISSINWVSVSAFATAGGTLALAVVTFASVGPRIRWRRVDKLDPNMVLGLFTYDSDPAFNNREIDIEASRLGNAADPTNAQFVVQPYTICRHQLLARHRACPSTRIGRTGHHPILHLHPGISHDPSGST
jgi:hypothetical protein